LEEQDLKLIFNAIESGKCLAFLGAGACTVFRKPDGLDEPGLLSGRQLAELLAKKCQYTNGTTYDLPKVAEHFLYECNGDRQALETAIRDLLQKRCTPRPIHTVLAQLCQIRVVITSNYDTLLESELGNYDRTLTKHVYNPTNPKTGHFQGTIFFGARDVILHKMHGSIDDPGSMVITESDYIQYLAYLHDIDRGMPEYFRKTIIPQFTLLFLGYSLQDWNFKVLWEGVLGTYASLNLRRDAFAIMRQPSHQQARYWTRRNIDILDMDLTDFAVKLAERFKLDIPQMNIEKGVQK
jgi:hypothetical protein